MGMIRGQTFLDGNDYPTGVSRDFNLPRTKTMDFGGSNIFSERAPSRVTLASQGISFSVPRPSSYTDRDFTEDRHAKSELSWQLESQPRQIRVPLLGPTRQQTETYLLKMAKKKNDKLERLKQTVIPIDGPAKHLAVGGRVVTGDIAVFEDKAANAVLLEADSQHKSGYPTLATSSMVAKRNRVSVPPEPSVDNQSDMRFFSELVKPIQYRWKFQKDKLKTLAPSKHGFHQRSQSPTFQRLLEANERLQDIAGHEIDEVNEIFSRDFIETQSELQGYLSGVKVPKATRQVKTEPASNRTSHAGSLPATSETMTRKENDLKPEIRNIDPPKKEKESTINKDPPKPVPQPKATPPKVPPPQVTPPQPPSKNPTNNEIKVDFKKHDSHSELHLFLPHIHDNNSRGGTPEDQHRKHKIILELPPIDDSSDVKVTDEDRLKYKKKTLMSTKSESKKKKKFARIKSSKEDKQIKDILNDVPTLISLETDKGYHPESMCVFENCALHKHRKSTRIRQA